MTLPEKLELVITNLVSNTYLLEDSTARLGLDYNFIAQYFPYAHDYNGFYKLIREYHSIFSKFGFVIHGTGLGSDLRYNNFQLDIYRLS